MQKVSSEMVYQLPSLVRLTTTHLLHTPETLLHSGETTNMACPNNSTAAIIIFQSQNCIWQSAMPKRIWHEIWLVEKKKSFQMSDALKHVAHFLQEHV